MFILLSLYYYIFHTSLKKVAGRIHVDGTRLVILKNNIPICSHEVTRKRFQGVK